MFIKRDRLGIPNVNKNDVILGTGQLDKNDATRVLTHCIGMPHDQKVKKAEEVTYLSINFGLD
jgi:hypothetical protein